MPYSLMIRNDSQHGTGS